ncbi:MAG TPA: hypothetical protein VEJ41_09485 [Candidatus Acidoferrales bacterium]|nr:hypothetical protein [Candidatus Acidoferrales bacterium]
MSAQGDEKLGRRSFVAGTLILAGALAGCKPTEQEHVAGNHAEFYKVLSPAEYDGAAMLAVLQLPRPHKQVFSATGLVVQESASYAALFAHMQFAMNGYDFSLGRHRGPLATLGVMAGVASVLGLTDAAWTKYSIGGIFNTTAKNVYWPAKSNLDPNVSPNDPHGLYQDWSAEAVQRRGGSFMVCHNALTKVAMRCAQEHGTQVSDVLTDFVASLQPGCLLVPAGVTAVQLAQEYGWKLYTVA